MFSLCNILDVENSNTLQKKKKNKIQKTIGIKTNTRSVFSPFKCMENIIDDERTPW